MPRIVENICLELHRKRNYMLLKFESIILLANTVKFKYVICFNH